MNLARGSRASRNIKARQINGSVALAIGMNPESVLVIKMPNSQVLRIMSRSLFLAMFIVALPSISSIVKDSLTNNLMEDYSSALTRPSDLIQFKSLPIVFEHLVDEGLLKNGHKCLLLSSGIGDLFDNLWFLNGKGIELVVDSDLERQMVIPNESFDFIFASSLENTMFINRVVKLDGIVVFPFRNHHDYYEFSKQTNYKIVYLHQFDSTAVIAMKKVDSAFNSQRKDKGGGEDGEGEDSVFG